MTVIKRAGITWAADRDGLAHARYGSAIRVLCGAVPVPEQRAWPIREMCAVCLTIEKAEVAAARRRRAGAA